MVCLVDFRERGLGRVALPSRGSKVLSRTKYICKLNVRICEFWCKFSVDCILSGSSFFRRNILCKTTYHITLKILTMQKTLVTVFPANADQTGHPTNRMRTYLRHTHIEVVNVLCVLCSSKKLCTAQPQHYTVCTVFDCRPTMQLD